MRRRSGGRRRGRGQEEWKGIDDIQMSLLSMVRYHMLLKHVYNIFFEGYTYDNHPPVKKAGKMGNVITHPQSHSMHIIQEWGGTEDGGNGGSTQVRRKGRRRGGRLIGREGKERRERGQRKGREEGDEREGKEGEKVRRIDDVE